MEKDITFDIVDLFCSDFTKQRRGVQDPCDVGIFDHIANSVWDKK